MQGRSIETRRPYWAMSNSGISQPIKNRTGTVTMDMESNKHSNNTENGGLGDSRVWKEVV